jgi:two-component system copper resistance phosphate regulon response regulator CusR
MVARAAMKILVVEDQKKTAAFLSKGLEEHGFVVDVAVDGKQGLQRALDQQYDLVVLDVMLPELDGWSILGELRAAKNPVPVLLLTARDSVQDRVRGLDLGADDYLVKPFAFSELLARIRSLLRRSVAGRPVDNARIADLEIDLVGHWASRCGQRLQLTAKEFALLSLLARRSGEVLSRALIADQVWGMNFETNTNFVDVHIRRLRAKVDEPFDIKLIHTVRGAGYVLEERP